MIPKSRLPASWRRTVVQCGADGRLLAVGGVAQGDLAAGNFCQMRLGIERVGLELEVVGQLSERLAGVSRALPRRASKRLLPLASSRTDMLRDWSARTTSVADCFLVSV